MKAPKIGLGMTFPCGKKVGSKPFSSKILAKVNERIHSNSDCKSCDTDSIVNEIYDAIVLEFQPKFASLEKELSIVKNQVLLLENRIAKIEVSLDDLEQESKLDSLIFAGVKQSPGSTVKYAVLGIIHAKMELTDILESDIISVS